MQCKALGCALETITVASVYKNHCVSINLRRRCHSKLNSEKNNQSISPTELFHMHKYYQYAPRFRLKLPCYAFFFTFKEILVLINFYLATLYTFLIQCLL